MRCSRCAQPLVAGSFLAIHSSGSRPAGFWISTNAAGRGSLSGRGSTCSAPTRRRVSKPGADAIRRSRPLLGDRSGSSMSTRGPAPGPISPRGMCIARACSAAVKSRRASFPSTGSWRTSCGRNRIARLVASFGLRTTAPRIGASARWRGCRPRGRSSFVSNSTTSTRRSRSSGRSRGAISSRCSPSSVGALHGRRREYVAIIANWSTSSPRVRVVEGDARGSVQPRVDAGDPARTA